jgi:hypothetical protein
MGNFSYRVLVSTPEGAEHEHKETLEAASYTEAILRGYTRTIAEAEKFRRDNKMEKLVIKNIAVFVNEVIA